MNEDLKKTLLNPIFKGNPITVLVLGICSSLAVTVQLKGPSPARSRRNWKG